MTGRVQSSIGTLFLRVFRRSMSKLLCLFSLGQCTVFLSKEKKKKQLPQRHIQSSSMPQSATFNVLDQPSLR